MHSIKPIVLIILDGWGHSERPEHNAIAGAQLPVWRKLWDQRPHRLISGSGMAVGLPDGQMGNSEVGHINLGAGRIVYQELTRITKAIADGEFQHNRVLVQAIDAAVAAGKAVHLMSLLSPGGVHSHEDHLFAAVRLAAARGAKAVYVHAFLDGRDTPPRSAQASLKTLDAVCAETGVARLATVVGRYYAMDRDQRWERVQAAYALLTEGKAEFAAASGLEALSAAYARGENDEFVKATLIGDAVAMSDGDALLFMNFRADRARQLANAFVAPDFDGFARAANPKLHFVCLTQYSASIPAAVAFGPTSLKNSLGEYLQTLGKKQLRIAETEKYAHVTFFFNGGEETVFGGEDRILVPSPRVATYDLKPEMSAPEVTDKLVAAIESGQYDFIAVNYANPDMVGHTGVYEAAVKAVECIDGCLGRLVEALDKVGGEALITADHGNVEQMHDEATGQAHTAHTCLDVPFVYVGKRAVSLRDGEGVLSDVAPTLLTLMGLPIPAEMTGTSLLSLD
ncbi:MAG: 2,3-bisphosphoglycerate-independent phosphoglycerate mutase [Gammaproteobacteria bacterium]|nr:2,3-bisphosphoglycerate-independent phosphoglycerate mutase [Gammaproteobacteria bacterium]